MARCERGVPGSWIAGSEMLVSVREFILKKVRNQWPWNLDRSYNLWFLLLCLKLDLTMSGMLSILNSQLNFTNQSMFFEEQSWNLQEFKRIVSLEISNFDNYWISFISTKLDFFTKGNKKYYSLLIWRRTSIIEIGIWKEITFHFKNPLPLLQKKTSYKH